MGTLAFLDASDPPPSREAPLFGGDYKAYRKAYKAGTGQRQNGASGCAQASMLRKLPTEKPTESAVRGCWQLRSMRQEPVPLTTRLAQAPVGTIIAGASSSRT